MDETSFMLNPKPGKVLAKRGTRHIHCLNINSEKECYTVLLGGELFELVILISNPRFRDKFIRSKS